MGHHRKGRHHRAAPITPEARPEPPAASTPAPRDGSRPSGGLSDRGIDELADAARAARRTGWPFGAEVLATVDTRGVPATTPPPRDGKPRRYATHQPTAPFPVVAPGR
jgi:hypothetical protein